MKLRIRMAVVFALAFLLCPLVSASRWNKLTRLEVNEPITIPGATLAPGEYVVRLADSAANRHIVRFLNGDQTKVIATVLAVPNRRQQPSGETELGFYETPAGEPVALRSWFYPGDTFGQEFVYPEKQARMIAGKSKRNVPSTADTFASRLSDTSVAPDSDPSADFDSTPIQSTGPDGKNVTSDAGFAQNETWDKEARAQTTRKTRGKFLRDDTRSRTDDRARRSMEREIRHELVMLPFYGVFDHLAFQVDGGKVTLLGAVTRPSLKESAERVAKQVEGVETVVNQIDVLPPSSADDRIRMATYRAIYGQTGLDRYALRAVPPIHIVVKNGNLRLEGVVANEADKNLAGIQAKSVPGVFSVENNLRVEGQG